MRNHPQQFISKSLQVSNLRAPKDYQQDQNMKLLIVVIFLSSVLLVRAHNFEGNSYFFVLKYYLILFIHLAILDI